MRQSDTYLMKVRYSFFTPILLRNHNEFDRISPSPESSRSEYSPRNLREVAEDATDTYASYRYGLCLFKILLLGHYYTVAYFIFSSLRQTVGSWVLGSLRECEPKIGIMGVIHRVISTKSSNSCLRT